ncbi:MAG: hypothetical protein V2A71_00075 [Candidatus Eisenbacteria bacterium]
MSKTGPNEVGVGSGDENESVLLRVVEELCAANEPPRSPITRRPHGQSLPSRDVVIRIVEALRSVIFPGYFGTSDLSAESVPPGSRIAQERSH